MGIPMASNIAGAGFPLSLWNRSIEKAEELATDLEASVCATPRELAEKSDVVITMLADDDASAEVHRGGDGLFSASGGATHLVEMGTYSPAHVRQMAAAARGRVVIDAPVSGSIDAARHAQLMIMVGADENDIDPIRPVLEAMSREIICFGHVGAGATMKLAVNLLIHGLNQTLAEALTLAEGAGISPADAYRAMEQSAAAAPMLEYRKPQYLDEAASPVSFALSLARKDVALALDLATELGTPMPQTRVNLQQLQDAETAGFGERDMASMVGYLRGAR
jgi:3-hydroxyisobutyrate dehydrogenase